MPDTELNPSITPVSVQNVKALMPGWNKKFDDWGQKVEESIDKRISVEIGKIDPSALASIRIDRHVTGKCLPDGTYYPGQRLEVENTVRIVRIFDTDVTIYSPSDKETFVQGDGFTVKDNKIVIPPDPRVEYFKFTSYIQLPSDLAYLGQTLEYELVAFTTHSIDVASLFVTMSDTIKPSMSLADMDLSILSGVGNVAAKYPQQFMEWATTGEQITIPVIGYGDQKFRVVAIQHYDTVAGGKCGLVLQSVNAFKFDITNIDISQPTLLNSLFTNQWRNLVTEVKIPKYIGESSSAVLSTVNAWVFAPSRAELMGPYDAGNPAHSPCLDKEGTQQAYWASHTTAQDRIRNDASTGSPTAYTCRSQIKDAWVYMGPVDEGGSFSASGYFVNKAFSEDKTATHWPLTICIGDSNV